MTAENPDLSEWGVGMSDDELGAAMLELEHEQRSNAFREVLENLQALRQKGQGSLFFKTYVPDARSRNALIVWHPKKGRQPPAVRVIVNDEKASLESPSQRLIEGKEYVFRPIGNLITTKTCSIAVPEDDSWRLGPNGFLLQKPVDNPMAYIFHGPNYRREFAFDTSDVDPLELTARRVAAENLVALLESLPRYEAMPTNYLFSLVSQ